MDKSFLRDSLHYTEKLILINEKLINWDLGPVRGIGLYKKIEKYAHIELKISVTQEYSSYIIWAVKDEQIPIEYKPYIEGYLIFFSHYISALKGVSINLAYEVVDGSFHVTDSRGQTYGIATLYALINCFDKEFNNLSKADEERIIRLKNEAPGQLRHFSKFFSEERKLASLNDLHIRQLVGSILSRENKDELLYLIRNNVEELERRIKSVASPDVLSELTETNFFNTYGDITYIGLAHLALFYNQKDLLNHYGIFNLNKLNRLQ